MDLYLLRHGDAGKVIINGGGGGATGSCHEALTESGKTEIAIVARSLKALNLKISAILTSPLRCAVQPAKILAKVLGIENKMLDMNRISPK